MQIRKSRQVSYDNVNPLVVSSLIYIIYFYYETDKTDIMSWYRETDGTIVVEDGQELLKNHLNHGFWTREDGKVILQDYDLLYLCGKEHKKRRFFGRRDSEEVTWKLPYKNAIKLMKKDSCDYGDCPMDKSKCRFWNDNFNICSIYSNFEAKKKENVPCIKNDKNACDEAV